MTEEKATEGPGDGIADVHLNVNGIPLRAFKHEKEKPECRVCACNHQYHGMGGCFRARTKGGPTNCIDFTRSVHADD